MELWVRKMSGALVEEYFLASAGADFVPTAEADRAALLEIFVFDHAMRELVTQLDADSDRVSIPLADFARMSESR